jgi:tetratricopeptide (TPR) repeat protein
LANLLYSKKRIKEALIHLDKAFEINPKDPDFQYNKGVELETVDREQEEILIKAFFKKRVHERVLFALSSPKRRLDALSRLCHDFDKMLEEQYMVAIPKPNSDVTKIANLLKQQGTADTCYVVSWNKEVDGKQLRLFDALERVVGFGMPSIISCVPGRLAYFEGEQEFGSPPRYILRRSGNEPQNP